MKLSTRVSELGPSATLLISARAKGLVAEGKDVLNFAVGEPDFPTPAPAIEATVQALHDGKTKYAAASGTPELKKEVAKYYKNRFNLDYEMANVSINVGAKHSLYNIFQALVEKNDEVILPAPYWVSYYAQILLAEATPVVINTTDESSFKITVDDLKKHTTKNTKILVLNSPSNPTGCVYNRDELLSIANFCLENNILIVYDEIYEHIIYGQEHVCIATLSDDIKKNTILVNGVAKSFSMTGFRIGYILAEKNIITAINNIQSHSTSNPTTFAMDGALAALQQCLGFIDPMKLEFEKRMKYFFTEINKIPNIKCFEPQGAFYLFPNMKGLLNKDINGKKYSSTLELATALLDDLHIAAVAGEEFGAPGYIRFSYATSIEQIEKSIERLKKWLS